MAVILSNNFIVHWRCWCQTILLFIGRCWCFGRSIYILFVLFHFWSLVLSNNFIVHWRCWCQTILLFIEDVDVLAEADRFTFYSFYSSNNFIVHWRCWCFWPRPIDLHFIHFIPLLKSRRIVSNKDVRLWNMIYDFVKQGRAFVDLNYFWGLRE